ncbi:MAG: glycerol kinase GlpK [Candidatus Hydrogenedentes bacterium]|nr:glycerol kinase GlpK [Candidatus Hydrogenedentota bacterium]
MAAKYILALDQGTTSSRSILFTQDGAIAAVASQEFPQIYPRPGWVEHDPIAIWESQLATAETVIERAGAAPGDIAAIGITNQRETTLVWDRATGQPVHNAIVWQCRRTTDTCEQLKAAGLEAEFRGRTGLVIDAYFSGTKVKWILDHVPGARERARRGELCFGTVDTWLLYKLTGAHATDYSNASRTLLFNIHDRDWDPFLLEKLDVPAAMLPEARPTSGIFGATGALGGEIPVAALVGDQQSALFGQAGFHANDCKNTYGTGCFLLMNTGSKAVASTNGLLTTIGWGIGGEVAYALEGSVFVAGAVVQWLRDELKLIGSAAESETIAGQTPDANGVYLVPAFVGLGAPYWDMRARGVLTGLTRGANRAHIVRAALESIAYQSADLVHTMEKDTSAYIPRLKVDGGACANNLLMQFQADLLGIPVVRGKTIETTALGAAFLAGLAVGFWSGPDELAAIWKPDRTFEPGWDETRRKAALAGWADAVRRAKS